jgi:hypothetical protein
MATTKSRLEQIKNFRLDPKIKLLFGGSVSAGSPMTPVSGHHLAIDFGEAAQLEQHECFSRDHTGNGYTHDEPGNLVDFADFDQFGR